MLKLQDEITEHQAKAAEHRASATKYTHIGKIAAGFAIFFACLSIGIQIYKEVTA